LRGGLIFFGEPTRELQLCLHTGRRSVVTRDAQRVCLVGSPAKAALNGFSKRFRWKNNPNNDNVMQVQS